MRKMITSIATILAVSALMVGAASAADKLVVKGTSGADGNVFRVDDTGLTEAKAAFLPLSDAIQNVKPIFSVYNNDVLRSKIRPLGIQEWYLSSGAAESGKINYSTPGGGVGIGLFTGATYDQNQANIANYPTIGTGGNALAAFGYTTGGGMVTIDKTTGNVGVGFLWTPNAPTNKLDVDGNSIRIRTTQTPVSTAACNAGAIAWDANFIYVCTGSGAWKRASLSAY